MSNLWPRVLLASITGAFVSGCTYSSATPQATTPVASLLKTAPAKPKTRVSTPIVSGARAQVGISYDASYVKLKYPNGDVARNTGVCTDVIIRALRADGRDLQRLIHEDMTRNWKLYPRKWGLRRPDKNIDHRRVPNQMVFFRRFGRELTRDVSASTLAQWKPGDIVCWDLGGPLHTGIVSDQRNNRGVPLVIHNLGGGREEDALRNWKIIGHFRYPAR